MTASRTDLNGIKSAIQTVLQDANTTTASPIDLSANLLNSKRVQHVLRINPEMIMPQASFFPLVTCFIPDKTPSGNTIAKDQLNNSRQATVEVKIVGSIWNNNFRTLDEDPADEDINYLMENIELALRANPNLSGKVLWQKPVGVKYYTTVMSQQSHLRSGILTLECEVFY